MGRTAINLTGRIFGRLTVLTRDTAKTGKVYWVCQCSCGNLTSIAGVELTRKNRGVKSCGCLTKETVSRIKKKYNTFDLSGDYGIGFTEKGKEFYFDLEDFDKIKNYCWRIDHSGYVVTNQYTKKKSKEIKMHRLIMGFPINALTDHKNRNRNDNRKFNLRIATNSQNCINHSLRKDSMSGITGVLWHTRDKIWEVSIGVNNKQLYLGRFNDLSNAITARREAEKRYHGEYSPVEIESFGRQQVIN